MIKRTKNGGFTLIELLVVVAIISLLSSIILASLSTAKQKANDAATLEEVHQVQLAMELYNNDNNGFPNPTGFLGYYCLGAATCTGPFGPVTNQLAMAGFKYDSPSNPSLFGLLAPKVAEASTYTTAGGYLASFSNLAHPLVYYCASSGTTCSSSNAYVWYLTGSGAGTWNAQTVDTGNITTGI
jgi:prepilin-type N-terminal cleavage/methylation domain-containing protein